MAAAFDGDAGPANGYPVTLFERRITQIGVSRSCDIAPDGNFPRFIEEDSDSGTIDLILNRSTPLLRQVP